MIQEALGEGKSSEEWSIGRTISQADITALIHELASSIQKHTEEILDGDAATGPCPVSSAPA